MRKSMFMLWLDLTQLTGQFKERTEPPHNNQRRHMAGSRKEEGWEEEGAARLMKLHLQNCVIAKPHTHIPVSELYCGFQCSLKCLQNNVFRVVFQWEKGNHFFGLLCKVCPFQKWRLRLLREYSIIPEFSSQHWGQEECRAAPVQGMGVETQREGCAQPPAQKVHLDQKGKEIQSSFANS